MAVLCGMPTIQYTAGSAVSCMESTGQGNNFELISMVKTEARHAIEESFGSEFPAICNHCGVMAAGSLKTPKTP